MRRFCYVAQSEDAGRSVGNILLKELRLSRGLISRLKFHQGLFLDGQSVRTNAQVQPGQMVEAILRDEKEMHLSSGTNTLQADVRYEDEDLFILYKPAPLPSVSSVHQHGDTMESRLYAYMGNPACFVYRPVNRLDKGTSGLMVAAKNAFSQEKLQKDLHSDRFIRRYQAVCEGKLPAREGIIDLPIARESAGGVRRVVCDGGKRCVTHYRVIRETDCRTLVELQLETGRTHQIRVHLAALGCPLVGDYLYGRESEELPGRFALHACYVKLCHPVTGAWIEMESSAPEAFQKLLD